jgi:hypothetical protein
VPQWLGRTFVFAQLNEQYFRLLKTPKSSSRPLKEFRSIWIPQRSQDFSGSIFRGVAI